ncbi:LysR family transcriptional regulator [Bradyrhizobium sp. AUGA SZCCT0431]|uniref:LysR family transcriptional regulator n=1 Tax=Bradyrhizobium sp. AUGA SZCCT0431 TaxID=2807674 RepID=UPI00201274BE|nr:LysR family transcriptional regulator [Bradyrhizobium sp. AUGA SZCCT0431]
MIVMKALHLHRVDLNLLVVFDALMAEEHATRAAERIGLTQPAVSHALNRLRALFSDPLFVRSPRGMTPTPAALEAAPAIRSILEQVEGVLLGGRVFDPKESTRQFVLGLSDYAAFVFLPRLTGRLEREAPGVSLIVRNTSRGVGLPMLDDGIVELIAGNFPVPPSHMREELLYEEDFVCAGRIGNPALDRSLDLERYLSLRHLQVSMKGEPHGYVDAVLRDKNLKRNVTVTVGHFLMAPHLVGTSDLVATEPRRLFGPLAGRLPLQLSPPPIDIPSFRVVQAWHARNDADLGHKWLRQVVREIGQWVDCTP